jgi:demethylmenaquinone methyltransferase/2-methoxy-6-polyprenyl-1,4-benzoquinol methylase
MSREEYTRNEVTEAYRGRAPSYNLAVSQFDRFAWFGFDIAGWRRQSIAALNLRSGDTVVDIGCGTGLNFPLMHPEVGPYGRIIGVDLSNAMLDQARHMIAVNHWANVHLECEDATRFDFPPDVNAVLSTYTLTLVPDCERVVRNASAALAPGGRLAVLDMAWPRYWPFWWRYVLFFLRSYGVTVDVLRRRPWDAVRKSMNAHLHNVSRRQFWFGFFYLSWGTALYTERGEA